MAFVNLTPHVINVVSPSPDGEGDTVTVILPPSGKVARVSSETRAVGFHEGIALMETNFGEVIDLPEVSPETTYVVSGMVRSALPGRTDLASPGKLLRDAEGRPVGCEGLVINR